MIEVKISKKFRKKSFYYDFKSDKNKIVVFGPSGAGKSNLVKMIAGFYPPDDGTIVVNKTIFFDRRGRIDLAVNKRNVGYLPQEYTLFPHLTIKENILYGVKVGNAKYDENLFSFLVDTLEIGEYLNYYPGVLSGGQKQRVAIARAFMVKPKIFVFDEPFSSLDKPIKEKLIDVINYLLDIIKIPAIFITHDIDDSYLLGEDVVIVKEGRVIEYGSKDVIFDRPRYVETASLVNFKNIWKIDRVKGNLVIIDGINLDLGENLKEASFLGIRPENVMILRKGENNRRENILDVTVKNIKKMSGYYELLVTHYKLSKIVIKLPEHAFKKLSPVLGKDVKVSLKKESLVLMRRYGL
ncbi:sulfate/molybdate ABC transporter ATP-binding protein [Deferribacter abyssi]|uniref:sulfate/molybdate ABC transporter ATP-binding protein n=1 Tax=Deferribacter abyssi TaxID=213806 RepID=UPI003C176CDF